MIWCQYQHIQYDISTVELFINKPLFLLFIYKTDRFAMLWC